MLKLFFLKKTKSFHIYIYIVLYHYQYHQKVDQQCTNQKIFPTPKRQCDERLEEDIQYQSKQQHLEKN